MNVIFNTVSNVGYGVYWILLSFHHACLWIGWAITTVYLCIFRSIFALIVNILTAIPILCEDLVVFVEDVVEVTEKCFVDAFGTTWLIVESFYSSCRYAVGGLIHLPTHVARSVMSYKLGSFCLNLAWLIKEAVLLIGIWIWELFALGFAALSYLNETPYIVCILCARALDQMLINMLQTIETNLFKSICGLFMGYGAVFLAKKTGLMPREGTYVLVSRIYKWNRSNLAAAADISTSLWMRTAKKLNSTVIAVSLFILNQWQTVKVFARMLFQEAVIHTPTKAALEMRLEKETAAMRCVVCLDSRRDVIILNCRHLTMCRICALTVAVDSGECPICRSPIEDIISVYT